MKFVTEEQSGGWRQWWLSIISVVRKGTNIESAHYRRKR